MAPSGRGVKRVGPGEFRCGHALGRRPPLPFNERRPGGRSARQHPPAQLAGRRLGAQHAVARWPVRIVPRTAAVRRYRRSDTIFPYSLKHNMLAFKTLALVCHPEPENRRAPKPRRHPPPPIGCWGVERPRSRERYPPGRLPLGEVVHLAVGALAALVGGGRLPRRARAGPGGGRRRCKRHQVVPTQLFTVRGALP